MKQPVIKNIFRYIKPYSFYIVTAAVPAFISVLLALYIPVLTGQSVDLVIGAGNVDFGGILPIIIKMILAVVLSSVFTWVMNYSANKITFNSVRDIRSDFYKKLNSLPLSYIDSTSHGDIISRITVDTEQISDGMQQFLTQFLTGVITIIGTIAFMLSINFKIALVVIFITPLSLFAAAFITKISRVQFTEQSKVRGELSSLIVEAVEGSKAIKAFSFEKRAEEKFTGINSRLFKCGVKSQFYSALANPTTRYINGLVYAFVGIIGALSIVNGTSVMTVGSIASFLSYANQYTKPFNEITGVITELQSAFACARRVFAVMEETPEPSDENCMDITDSDGSVEISNASFSYNKKIPFIENLNLYVKKGQRIAVVGPTGCGKTTLINLLMRFYDVTDGSICIDEKHIDIRSIKRDSLRKLYGMVLQDTWVFKGSVRENIAYGNPGASIDKIIEASKAVHAHGFIKKLPDGYDTILSKDGGNLSGGEKQLISIARIMLMNPPMLILDEATSNIDSRTEQRVQKAFKALMRGKTCFIIAHRLSTIKDADIILVMRGGVIAEKGTHEELLNNRGFYHELFNAQFEQTSGHFNE